MELHTGGLLLLGLFRVDGRGEDVGHAFHLLDVGEEGEDVIILL